MLLVFVLLLISICRQEAWWIVPSHSSSWRSVSKLGSLRAQNTEGEVNPQIFVCTNRWCREKGADTTMATFSFLCPVDVSVQSVNCLGRCNKGPNARILTKTGSFVEASAVRSVDSIVDLLQKHLDMNVNVTSAEVLRLNYEGNILLRAGKVDDAIDKYSRALSLGDREQEGVLLVMRGTALLQRAYACRMRYKDIMLLARVVLPSFEGTASVVDAFSRLDSALSTRATLDLLTRTNDIFTDVNKSPRWEEAKLNWPESREGEVVSTGSDLLSKATFVWALYEHALAAALEDLLMATIVMPGFAQAWRRAGDVLSELRIFSSAIEYYEVAMKLDGALAQQLLPTVERLRMMDRLVEGAETKGWSAEAVMSLIED